MSRFPTVLALALLAAGPALAHAFLVRASPAAGSEHRTPPNAVTIVLSERIEKRFSGIEVRDAAGTRVAAAELATDSPQTIAVGLPRLPPGTYAVSWHAASVDTHKTRGTYAFTVLP